MNKIDYLGDYEGNMMIIPVLRACVCVYACERACLRACVCDCISISAAKSRSQLTTLWYFTKLDNIVFFSLYSLLLGVFEQARARCASPRR